MKNEGVIQPVNSESETVQERAQEFWPKWCAADPRGIKSHLNRAWTQQQIWEFAAEFASSLLQEKEQRIKELETAAQSSLVVIAALLVSTKWELSHTMLSELRNTHDKLLSVLNPILSLTRSK